MPHLAIPDGPGARDAVLGELGRISRPTTVVWDRRLGDGMPFTIDNRDAFVTEIDTMVLPPRWAALRHGGVLYGVRVPAVAASESR